MAALLLLLFSFILLLFLVAAAVVFPAFSFQSWLEDKGWPKNFPFKGMEALNSPLMFLVFIIILFLSSVIGLSIIAIYEAHILPMFK